MIEIVVFITAEWQYFHRKSFLLELDHLLEQADRLWIINRPVDWLITPWRKPGKLKQLLHPCTRESAHRYLVTPHLPIHDQLAYRLPFTEAFNLKILRNQLLPLLTPSSKKILWLMHPCFMPYSRLLDWDMLIYDCYDEYIDVEGNKIQRLIRNYEASLLQGGADLIVFAASAVQENKRKQFPSLDNDCLLPNLSSERHFGPARRQELALPSEFKDISFPRLIYIGGIKPDLDQILLKEIARQLPHVAIILIGGLEHGTQIDDLLQFPNIHWLGPKSYEELPAYLQACQVGLIPYVLNSYIQTISPNKASEYLLAGLEVVSSNINALKTFDLPQLHLALSHADFIAQIQHALSRYPQPISDEVATTLSREPQLQKLLQYVRQHLQQRLS